MQNDILSQPTRADALQGIRLEFFLKCSFLRRFCKTSLLGSRACDVHLMLTLQDSRCTAHGSCRQSRRQRGQTPEGLLLRDGAWKERLSDEPIRRVSSHVQTGKKHLVAVLGHKRRNCKAPWQREVDVAEVLAQEGSPCSGVQSAWMGWNSRARR